MKPVFRRYFSLLGAVAGLSLCSFSVSSNDITIGGIPFKRQVIAVAGGESAVATGDFNEDGFQDIAIANNADTSVTIFLATPAGQFLKTVSYAAGHDPSDIVSADINGDRKLDLVISNHDTTHVSLFLGDGSGEFTPADNSPMTIPVLPHPHIVKVLDIDGDNYEDLIVDSRDSRGLLFLKGLESNQFDLNGTIINTGGDPYMGFAIGDINHDGVMDFAAPNSDHISVVLGAEDGTYAEPVYFPVERPFAVELVDMNGDDNLDIVAASMTGPVTVITGDGSGAFEFDGKLELEFPTGAKRIAVGDMNGDGISDALISNWSSDVMVLLGGEQGFEVTRFKPQDIQNPWMSKLADMNNDQKSDLIISDGAGGQVLVYMSSQ